MRRCIRNVARGLANLLPLALAGDTPTKAAYALGSVALIDGLMCSGGTLATWRGLSALARPPAASPGGTFA